MNGVQLSCTLTELFGNMGETSATNCLLLFLTWCWYGWREPFQWQWPQINAHKVCARSNSESGIQTLRNRSPRLVLNVELCVLAMVWTECSRNKFPSMEEAILAGSSIKISALQTNWLIIKICRDMEFTITRRVNSGFSFRHLPVSVQVLPWVRDPYSCSRPGHDWQPKRL